MLGTRGQIRKIQSVNSTQGVTEGHTQGARAEKASAGENQETGVEQRAFSQEKSTDQVSTRLLKQPHGFH